MADIDDVIKLLDRGNVDGALALAEDVKDRPKMLEVLNDYAALLAKESPDYEGIDKILNKVVELDPKHADAYYNLGCLYTEIDVVRDDPSNVEKAIEYYKKAVEANPKHVKAHYNLGLLYAYTNRLDEAREEYVQLIRLDSANLDKYDHLEGLIKSREA